MRAADVQLGYIQLELSLLYPVIIMHNESMSIARLDYRFVP
ncbi:MULTISPECIES: hypothetical protein [Sporomusa]|nr:hypothetical protein [Sporomusa sp. GT1]